MGRLVPLNYGDIATYLSGYPLDAPILIDLLSDPDCGKEFVTGSRTVGQVLEHCREMPVDGIPVLRTEQGPHLTIGVCFTDDSPIVILGPVDEG